MTAEFPDIWPALPEIFIAVAAMALLLIGVFRGDRFTRPLSYITMVVMLLAAVLSLGYGTGRVVTFNGLFVMDAFAVFMKVLILIAAAASVLLTLGYNEREKIARFEFPVLMLLATLGMLMMVSANDLMSLYIGLETQSLALYVIAAFRRDSARSAEAGLKYFVLGSLSSGLLLYGASLIYGFSGTTSFDQIAALFASGEHAPIGMVIGLVFVTAGLAFKISAAPFHMWTPDVYEGAPTPVTAFFAAAPKVAAMALIVRVLIEPFGAMADQWQQVIIGASILSMFIGSFVAIQQTSIKRMMAYSSIAHVGYALIGLAAGNELGIRGVLFYMASYVVMSLGAFAVILTLKRQGRMLENISDFAGLSRSNPKIAAIMAALMLSMAGIPLFVGFWSKYYVLYAAVQADLYALAIIGVLTSVVGAFYYLRIIKVMFVDEAVDTIDRVNDDGLSGVMIVSGVLTVLLFIIPAPLLSSATIAAAALFAG